MKIKKSRSGRLVSQTSAYLFFSNSTKAPRRISILRRSSTYRGSRRSAKAKDLRRRDRARRGAEDMPAFCIAHAAAVARDARILSALVTRDASGTLSRSSLARPSGFLPGSPCLLPAFSSCTSTHRTGRTLDRGFFISSTFALDAARERPRFSR